VSKDRVKLLHDAFWLYADAAGQAWKIKIGLARATSGAGTATPNLIRIDLTPADAEALAAVLTAAAEQRRGGGLRVGARSLIDTSDVAGWLHVRPSTIRSWLTRGGPKGNPFPPPDRRYHGRTYWERATVEAWQARQGQPGRGG
jgi:hypothetical protein